MADFVIVDGDIAIFEPTFTGTPPPPPEMPNATPPGQTATVTVKPGNIKSGASTVFIDSKLVCINGDETTVEVAMCPYVSPPFVGGMGTLTIQALAKDQVAEITDFDKILGILKGSDFIAKFTVDMPAKTPPGVSDTVPSYTGKGHFVNSNTFAKAT